VHSEAFHREIKKRLAVLCCKRKLYASFLSSRLSKFDFFRRARDLDFSLPDSRLRFSPLLRCGVQLKAGSVVNTIVSENLNRKSTDAHLGRLQQLLPLLSGAEDAGSLHLHLITPSDLAAEVPCQENVKFDTVYVQYF
jgi:hypothetical protein